MRKREIVAIAQDDAAKRATVSKTDVGEAHFTPERVKKCIIDCLHNQFASMDFTKTMESNLPYHASSAYKAAVACAKVIMTVDAAGLLKADVDRILNGCERVRKECESTTWANPNYDLFRELVKEIWK